MTEQNAREQIVRLAGSLFERGYGCGSSGNLSVRLNDRVLITPTNSCLGRLQPDQLAVVDLEGRHLEGPVPSKESFLHLAMYRARPSDTAIVHLHSTYSVAVSCLRDVEPADVLPPLTAYYVMRVGKLPLVPYFPPGDRSLADAVSRLATGHRSLLLANHGPVVAGPSLDAAVFAIEELEQTARLYLLLGERPVRLLTEDEVRELRERFPT